MKIARFIFLFFITVALGYSLNIKIDQIPPLGKFLSPFQGFWKNAEPKGQILQENLKIEGLRQPVKVYFDEMQIPHIYAENTHDLHMTHGYLTAKDRLWQMDFLSRVVTGRLSEVLGPTTLNTDRYLRRIGLKDMTLATREVTKSNAELEEVVQSYTEGVNAYINTLSPKDYPVEFKLLDYAPEPWTVEKTHLAYALLSQTLSMGESDLENTNALSILGREIFDLLYPEQRGNLNPVISTDTKWNFEPIKVEKPAIEIPFSITKRTIEKPDPLNGSNNFAIAPSKSASGHVLLANEPDLNLTLPSIWHAVHLHNADKNVMGVTVPGTPVILIGFNDSIAWGVTNSPRDQVDWYSVTFRDGNREEYLYNNQWFKTSKSIEAIKVSGSETYYDTIIHTHQGPVVYDWNYLGNGDKTNYAMRWIAHDPSTTFIAMHELNNSKNYNEMIAAMQKFQGPPQNVIFGSVSGDIAMTLPGKFPVKWEEQGKFLMDGSEPAAEWSAYIPFEQIMKQKNPERQFVSSANQHQVSSEYPYYVYDYHYEYYRGRRINERLSVMDNIVPKDMMKLQNDNYSYHASETLPTMLNLLDTNTFQPKEWEHYHLLADWDYFANPESLPASAFQTWWDIFYTKLWDEFDTISAAVQKPNKYVTSYLLINDSLGNFTNELNTTKEESRSDLINVAFRNSLDSLNNWKSQKGNYNWAYYKNTSINHYLKLPPFSRSGIDIGGYSGIVNAAAKHHGPSWRMVVELDPDGMKAWGVYPGSQTGNPGNPQYGHMIDQWASGEYNELLFGNDISSSSKITFTQTLLPK